MSNLFNLTRNSFLAFAKDLDKEALDIQPEQFNNTIHWHVGHVLVTTERLLFEYPAASTHFPVAYNALFKNGTKPADWTDNVPSISELVNLLEEQSTRINALSDDFFAQAIPFTMPFGNFKTYDDIRDLIIMHENDHLGKMKAMKQVIKAS